MYISNDGTTTTIAKGDAASPSRLVVVGDAASGAARAGAPVAIGVSYVAAPTAVDDGDVVDWLGDAYGRGEILDGSVLETNMLASAARTATINSADFRNFGATGAMVVVDVTNIVATPSVTPTFQVKGLTGGDYITIATAAAPITNVTGVGEYIYVLHPTWDNAWAPGVSVAEEVYNVLLTRTWRVRMVHGDADSITYSVDALYLK